MSATDPLNLHWQNAVQKTREGKFILAEKMIRDFRCQISPQDWRYHQSAIDLADTLREPAQIDEALKLTNSAAEYFCSIGDRRGEADAYHHRARTYLRSGDLNRAIIAIQRALQLVSQYNHDRHSERLPTHPGQVWVCLDYAQILGERSQNLRARLYGVRAIRSILSFWFSKPERSVRRQVNWRHVLRALYLVALGKGRG